eukprot:CAMPEP_0170489924 /NCGR_PEP_ID=MMETSP0208-20121228/8215_1 /TAXON_ID=197538 /ORGANISM="Strombidium inclinatum, Strain S3" /LENGTH=107 /DNA_ID=CAMNT_0010765083 /DNA_START=999 /DNA_END=1322 /DNA_ORIENTATION=+
MMMISILLLNFTVFFFFAKVMQQLEDEKFRFMLEQNQENEQFKRIINAVDDAMIIISGETKMEVTFKNNSAVNMFLSEEEATDIIKLKQFYCFQKGGRKEVDLEGSS